MKVELVGSLLNLQLIFLSPCLLSATAYTGFESGDFSEWDWGFDGDDVWTITSSEAAAGTYSARAKAPTGLYQVGPGTLALKVNVPEVGAYEVAEISFYCRVSTEEYWAGVRFMIDGREVQYFTGEAGWTQVVYPVETGLRDLTWTFEKEGNGGLQQPDSFWLDDVEIGVREGYAPSEAVMLASLRGHHFGDRFISATRWDNLVPRSGDWTYERSSADVGIITQTFDYNGNDPSDYRKETILTFISEYSGSVRHEWIADNSFQSGSGGFFTFYFKWQEPEHWYAAASEIDPPGWRYYSWFKGFKPKAGTDWIYHGRHGWLYVIADDTSRMFLWDGALGRWMFTNETVYPWMYAYGPDGGWVLLL